MTIYAVSRYQLLLTTPSLCPSPLPSNDEIVVGFFSFLFSALLSWETMLYRYVMRLLISIAAQCPLPTEKEGADHALVANPKRNPHFLFFPCHIDLNPSDLRNLLRAFRSVEFPSCWVHMKHLLSRRHTSASASLQQGLRNINFVNVPFCTPLCGFLCCVLQPNFMC